MGGSVRAGAERSDPATPRAATRPQRSDRTCGAVPEEETDDDLTDEEAEGSSQRFVRDDGHSPGPIVIDAEVYAWCIELVPRAEGTPRPRLGRRHAGPARREPSLGVPEHGSRMNQEWQLRWVRVPQGTHLSNSKATQGAARDLLREDSTNRNLGPTESILADEDALYGVHFYETNSPSGSGGAELSWGQQIAVDIVEDVVKAVDWDAIFEQIVAPAIKRTMGKFGKRLRSAIGRADGRAGTEITALTPDAHADSSEEVGISIKAPRLGMSSAEYRERVIAALAADAYAAWQREILANVRIEDGNLPPELTSAMKLVLEGKIASLDEDALAAVMKFLNGSQTADSAYALSRGRGG